MRFIHIAALLSLLMAMMTGTPKQRNPILGQSPTDRPARVAMRCPECGPPFCPPVC